MKLHWLAGFFKNQRGDVNWTPIYILILAAIAVILLVSVIKPMFQAAVQSSAMP
jgi:hypothetical protein